MKHFYTNLKMNVPGKSLNSQLLVTKWFCRSHCALLNAFTETSEFPN